MGCYDSLHLHGGKSMNRSIESDTALTQRLPQAPASVERRILDAVAGIRYGSVVIAIQDGKVVQIESTEKQRIVANG
jgi:hypothetical protein